MSKESQFWASIRPAFKGGHVVRIENSIGLGDPDVNFCIDGYEGWIELKSIRNAPKRKDTIVRCRHYTTEQKLWLSERKRAGGKVFLLVKLERTYYLFSSLTSFEKFGSVPKSELSTLAQAMWINKLNHDELIEELKYE